MILIHYFEVYYSGVLGCLRYTKLCWGWQTCGYSYETDELPNPRPTPPLSVAFGPLFPHSRYFFVGWDWFYVGNCRMAEVCRKGTLGSVLAWRAASLLLIRLLFVLKPPLWEREIGQAAEWACGCMTQEIHVFPTHGTFLWYLTTIIFYNATCSRNPT